MNEKNGKETPFTRRLRKRGAERCAFVEEDATSEKTLASDCFIIVSLSLSPRDARTVDTRVDDAIRRESEEEKKKAFSLSPFAFDNLYQ